MPCCACARLRPFLGLLWVLAVSAVSRNNEKQRAAIRPIARGSVSGRDAETGADAMRLIAPYCVLLRLDARLLRSLLRLIACWRRARMRRRRRRGRSASPFTPYCALLSFIAPIASMRHSHGLGTGHCLLRLIAARCGLLRLIAARCAFLRLIAARCALLQPVAACSAL